MRDFSFFFLPSSALPFFTFNPCILFPFLSFSLFFLSFSFFFFEGRDRTRSRIAEYYLASMFDLGFKFGCYVSIKGIDMSMIKYEIA